MNDFYTDLKYTFKSLIFDKREILFYKIGT